MDFVVGPELYAVDTVFIGGGTPTWLAPRHLESLLSTIARHFLLADAGEFTVESNPNTLSDAKIAVLADYGVNRISLGAQSFHLRLLERLDRDHDPASVGRAIELVRRRIDNVSLDLIFGIPGQTTGDWADDLDAAAALQPDHLSAYGLTYEKGTPLWRARQAGQIASVEEETERQMYDLLVDRMPAAGFEQYEISNFARIVTAKTEARAAANRQCRHNLIYWANLAYWGFGLGAVAYVAGERRQNTRSFEVYLDRARRRQSVVTSVERLDAERRARETAMLQLRRASGIERAAFQRQTAWSLDDLAGSALQPFVELGFLIDDGRRVRLSRTGLPVANAILRAVL
jgi:oxygen-independent coproporphyrinogen-3 oxidase